MRNNILLSILFATFALTSSASCTSSAEKHQKDDSADVKCSGEPTEVDTSVTKEDVAAALDCDIDYLKEDSAQIVKWLSEAKALGEGTDYINFFSPKFLGLPYGGRTLEKNDHEILCINTKKVDCLTYVENVMALSLCAQHKEFTFESFCKYLRTLRYKKGQPVSYESRNHYFFGWADSNIANGFFEEITAPADLFQKGHWTINYMTQNPEKYAGITNDKTGQVKKLIAEEERRLSAKEYLWIPEDKIPDNISEKMRGVVRDGDIIMILTNKKGLDTQHVTLARWANDGKLHIRHASSTQKHVVNESKTLYQYLKSLRTATGIRILRLKK